MKNVRKIGSVGEKKSFNKSIQSPSAKKLNKTTANKTHHPINKMKIWNINNNLRIKKCVK